MYSLVTLFPGYFFILSQDYLDFISWYNLAVFDFLLDFRKLSSTNQNFLALHYIMLQEWVYGNPVQQLSLFYSLNT